MADLDDFFAKKDKKKKKGFSKANTDIIAKNLAENERKELEADKEAAILATELSRPVSKPATEVDNEDDWKKYEDKKDMSNLKVEALKVVDSDNEGQNVEDRVDENGEKVRTSKKIEGTPAWSKVIAKLAKEGDDNDDDNDDDDDDNDDDDSDKDGEGDNENTKKRESSENEKREADGATAAETKSAYVPPHLRNAGAGGGGGGAGGAGSSNSGNLHSAWSSSSSSRRNKNAPDLNNHAYFPSLADSMSASNTGSFKDHGSREGALTSSRDYRNFEEVRGGQSHSSSNNRMNESAPKLSLDNKFAALRSGH